MHGLHSRQSQEDALEEVRKLEARSHETNIEHKDEPSRIRHPFLRKFSLSISCSRHTEALNKEKKLQRRESQKKETVGSPTDSKAKLYQTA